MMITIVITTQQVPFDQVVRSVTQFGGDTAPQAALKFINEQSYAWYLENEGDRSNAQGAGETWEPVDELGYNAARYELWDGECLFHAMLDHASFAQLHETHYVREYDAKGKARPGYLRNAYAAGYKPA